VIKATNFSIVRGVPFIAGIFPASVPSPLLPWQEEHIDLNVWAVSGSFCDHNDKGTAITITAIKIAQTVFIYSLLYKDKAFKGKWIAAALL
jgi:hypothetical protein